MPAEQGWPFNKLGLVCSLKYGARAAAISILAFPQTGHTNHADVNYGLEQMDARSDKLPLLMPLPSHLLVGNQSGIPERFSGLHPTKTAETAFCRKLQHIICSELRLRSVRNNVPRSPVHATRFAL